MAPSIASNTIANAQSSTDAMNRHSSATRPQEPQKLEPEISVPAPVKPISGSGVVYRQSDFNSAPVPAQQPSSSVAPSSDRSVSFAQQQQHQQSVASTSTAAHGAVSERDCSPPQIVPVAKVEAFDDDESYGLNSDDDAFYAAMDLGEDCGPPIYPEDDASVYGSYGDGPSVLGGYQAPKKSSDPSEVQLPPVDETSRAQPQQSMGQTDRMQPLCGTNQQQVRATHLQQPQRDPFNQNLLPQGRQVRALNKLPNSTRPVSSQTGGFHFPPGMVS
jgi:DNA repair and recombination protein RAD52